MLFGEYNPTFTGKHRLALPKKLREQITGIEVVLTKGFEKCIFGYDRKIWEEAARQELQKPISSVEGREIRRQMFAGAEITAFDDQGRFVISENLISFADIKNEITIIGAGDHFEIWDTNAWREYQKSSA